jgi:hypothetical protein
VIEDIHKADICLALSSQPRKDAALMSNRLFEGLAACALIICDEKPWARTHFGDTLLYVDLRNGAEVVAQQIAAHVEWARQSPEAALALAARAQEIFRRGYIMGASLATIYAGLQARKDELGALYRAKIGDVAVRVALSWLPDPADEAFRRQVAAARSHARQGFQVAVLVDRHDLAAAEAKLAALGGKPGAVETRGVDFFQRHSRGVVVSRNRMNPVWRAELQACPDGMLLGFVAPNETAFSNHVTMLAALLGGDPDRAGPLSLPRAVSGVRLAAGQHGRPGAIRPRSVPQGRADAAWDAGHRQAGGRRISAFPWTRRPNGRWRRSCGRRSSSCGNSIPRASTRWIWGRGSSTPRRSRRMRCISTG